jgi:Rho GDP-dissociation inhibitor
MTKENRNDESDTEEVGVPYKVPDAKPIDELVNLDKGDDSLRKWKESLGVSADGPKSIGEPGDDRRLVVLSLTVRIDGQEEPIVIDFTDKNAVEEFKQTPVKIKENTKYQTTVRFRIQHEIVAGVNYKLVAKRGGITFRTTTDALGSYAPNTLETPHYDRLLPEGETPGGMLARAVYSCTTTFTDDDGNLHLEFPWQLQITK